jgi:chemotaxis protein methyltransferase CheR
VLYYFDRDTQYKVLESLYEIAEPGGWLFTSVTESIRDLRTRWMTIQSGICRRQS